MSSRLQRGDLHNFPHMQAELQRQGKGVTLVDSARYEEHVQSIWSEFERRFTDFASVEPVASYMCYPFGASIDVGDIATKVRSFFVLESSALEDEILTYCKMTFRSKPDQHPLNLESMQCSRNY